MSTDWINGNPEELRRIRASQPEVLNPTLPHDVAISALPADGPCPGGLAFVPEAASGTPVIYFHGGGFVVGSPETHRVNTAWIAHLTRAPVFSIRYRLAPEHPLPAQSQDAVAAIRRQLARHPRLRLMGDSICVPRSTPSLTVAATQASDQQPPTISQSSPSRAMAPASAGAVKTLASPLTMTSSPGSGATSGEISLPGVPASEKADRPSAPVG